MNWLNPSHSFKAWADRPTGRPTVHKPTFDLVVTKKTAMMNSIIGDARSIRRLQRLPPSGCCYSGRLRRAAGRARRDDSFMEFYDISHESIISSSGAGLDLNYDKVQPTKITHFVKEPAAVR